MGIVAKDMYDIPGNLMSFARNPLDLVSKYNAYAPVWDLKNYNEGKYFENKGEAYLKNVERILPPPRVTKVTKNGRETYISHSCTMDDNEIFDFDSKGNPRFY